MKKFLRFSLLALLMTVFNGAWAEDVTVSMSSFTAISGNVGGDSNISYEAAKGGASTAPAVNNNEIRVYQNGGTFTVSAKNGAKIKSVTLGSSMATTVTYSVDKGTASDDQDIDANGTITIEDLDCSSILFTCTGTDKTHRLYVNYLSVTYTPPTTQTVATPTFDPVSGEYNEAQSVTISCETAGASIYYTTDGNEPTNESTEYTDAITVSETTTIKAIAYVGADASAVATATYTIVDPNGPGTANNPYTVEQARAAIDAGTGVTGVYAKGVVSEIVTAYNSQYGNITYNISTDGTMEAVQLQAYRGKSYNGDNFTSEDNIQVGDEVVIYGNLKKYNTTYEFEANNQLVSLTRPEGTPIDPELSFDPATITVEKGATYSQPTINCPEEIRSYLTITTDNEDVAFWTVQSGLVITTNVGTATITATYDGSYLDGKYKSATATLVVNVVDELPVEETATFDATKDIASTGETASAWSITKDGLTISCTNGVGGNGSEYRIYKNQTFTVSSTVGKITKIEFTATSNNPVSGFGEVEGLSDNTWTGSADEVAFTASGAQVRLTLVNITYEPNGVKPVADITTELTQLEVGSPIRWDDFVITYADGIEDPESEVSVDYDCDGFQMDLEQGLVPEEEGTATITFHFVYEGEETTYSDVDKTFTFNVVDNRPDPEFAFTPATMTIVLGEEFEQPVFTSADNDYFLDGGQAMVTSTNENVAYWTPEEGLNVVGLGTTDIKVTFISQFFDEWKSCEAVLTVNVVDELPTEVTATFDATKDIASTGTSQTEWSITKDGLTISCTNGVGGNGTEYRIYKNQTFTVSSTVGKITKIEFTATSSNPVSGFGEVEGLSDNTWTGSADEVAFTASGAQVRLTLVNVTYEPNGVEEPITVTISESTYATFYYETKAFEIPEGITASAVVRDGSSLSEIPVENVIPAGCPVLLHGAAGEYEFVETTEEGVMPTANSLIGSEEGGTYNEEGYKYYVLSYKNKNKLPEEVGFYFLSGSKGAYAKVKAHQAYMRVTTTQANEAGYSLFETTGISTVETAATESDAPMYNLAGQRVNGSYRGVVIQNGVKKVKK